MSQFWSSAASARRLLSVAWIVAALAALAIPAGALAAPASDPGTPDDPAAVLEGTFPADLDAATADPAQRAADSALVRVEDDYAVVVHDPGADHNTVVASTLPLTAKDDEGHTDVVDLGVDRQSDGSFAPENARTDVSFGAQSTDALTLEGSGISLGLSGAQPAEAVGDKQGVLYADSARDTDLVMTPSASGAESFLQVRSGDAPDSTTLRLDLPAGATAAQQHDGSVIVTRAGATLATVQAPTGHDAVGAPVAVSMSLMGNELRLSYPHADASLIYPLLIDPTITVSYGRVAAGVGYDLARGFDPGVSNPLRVNGVDYFFWATKCQQTYHGSGIACPSDATDIARYLYVRIGATESASSFGQWRWRVPNLERAADDQYNGSSTVYIQSASLYKATLNTFGDTTLTPGFEAGIWAGGSYGNSGWTGYTYAANTYSGSPSWNTDTQNATARAASQRVIAKLNLVGSGNRAHSIEESFQGMTVAWVDSDHAKAVATPASEIANPAASPSSRWVSSKSTFQNHATYWLNVKSTDTGAGVKQTTVYKGNTYGTVASTFLNQYDDDCDIINNNGCPQKRNQSLRLYPNGEASRNVEASEGDQNDFTACAQDGINTPVTADCLTGIHFGVDTAAPTDADTFDGTLPRPSGTVARQQYTLAYKSHDALSGVLKSWLARDVDPTKDVAATTTAVARPDSGTFLNDAGNTSNGGLVCIIATCPVTYSASRSIDFDSSDWPAGPHSLWVITLDTAGNINRTKVADLVVPDARTVVENWISPDWQSTDNAQSPLDFVGWAPDLGTNPDGTTSNDGTRLAHQTRSGNHPIPGLLAAADKVLSVNDSGVTEHTWKAPGNSTIYRADYEKPAYTGAACLNEGLRPSPTDKDFQTTYNVEPGASSRTASKHPTACGLSAGYQTSSNPSGRPIAGNITALIGNALHPLSTFVSDRLTIASGDTGPQSYCVRQDCSSDAGTGANAPAFGNAAIFGLQRGTIQTAASVYQPGIKLYLTDYDLPSFIGATGDIDDWISAGTGHITATATDPSLGVSKLRMSVPNTSGTPDIFEDKATCTGDRNHRCAASWNQPTQTSPGNPSYTHTFSYDVARMPEGEQPIGLQAVDIVSNASMGTNQQPDFDTTLAPKVLVDKSAPTGTLDALPAAIHGSISVAGDMTDRYSGPGTWQLQGHLKGAPDGAWVDACPSQASPISANRYGCTVDTTTGTFPDGTYEFRARMSDRVQSRYGGPNVTNTDLRSVVIDNTAPVLSLSGGLYQQRDNTLWDGIWDNPASASDALSGVVRLQMLVDGAPLTVEGDRTFVDPDNPSAGVQEYGAVTQACSQGACSLADRDLTFDTDEYAVGARQISVAAFDAAGNVAEIAFTVTNSHEDEPIGRRSYTKYSMGPSVAGMDMSNAQQTASPQVGDIDRSDETSYAYGTCDSGGSAGCQPPLAVQTSPLCQRHLALYSGPQVADHEDRTILGVPAVSYDNGQTLEIYTGDTTISIFGTSSSLVTAALGSLQIPYVEDIPLLGKSLYSVLTATAHVSALPPPDQSALNSTTPCE